MTTSKSKKKLVRELMATSGMSYMAALNELNRRHREQLAKVCDRCGLGLTRGAHGLDCPNRNRSK